MARGKLTVVRDRPSVPGFVCTWCAETLPSRVALDQHWRYNLKCARNRNASNQTQSKYNTADAVPTMPGARTLRLVRAHEERE